MTADPRAALVRLGEGAVARSNGALAALALGSCVAVVLHEPTSRIGGMVHVLLPSLSLSRLRDQPTRTADTAVPWLLDGMRDAGAAVEHVVARLVGGCTMFADLLPSGTMHIGERNVQACRFALRQAGVPIVGEAVGGTVSRSVWLDVSSGAVTVRVAGSEPASL